ncbi:hypothetical protein NSERUTF1_6370 [Nocardia seriolae]|nr:hypothetical protein NSERUTF1_6370 [Nocardia seriolae]
MAAARLGQETRQVGLFPLPPQELPDLAHIASYLDSRDADKFHIGRVPAGEIAWGICDSESCGQ